MKPCHVKLRLEQLEDRCCPTTSFGFNVVEIPAPPNIAANASIGVNAFGTAMLDTQALLFLGQFPWLDLGIRYEPNLIIRYDVTPAEWNALMGNYPQSTARWVVPTFSGGEVPIIFASTAAQQHGDQETGGIGWEQSCFLMGWWFTDPVPADFPPGEVYVLRFMPRGQQYGWQFAAPNYLFADVALAQGNPYWFAYI